MLKFMAKYAESMIRVEVSCLKKGKNEILCKR